MTLRMIPLDAASLDELRSALATAGLPVADLAESGRTFYRFDDDSDVAGYAGIEGEGADCLLRSLVVPQRRRSAGTGTAILGAIERYARVAGVARLHLLTTTAAGFLRARGYAPADRAAAPAAIAASREFTTLCPASAAYLTKTLDPA